jgi:hypothetical protein
MKHRKASLTHHGVKNGIVLHLYLCPVQAYMIFDAEICRPALPIDIEYDEDEIERQIVAGPPMTAEEYINRVRYFIAGMP